MPSPVRDNRIVLAVLYLTLVTWGGSILRSGFSYDDREVLFGNPVVEGSLPWTSAFDRDYWHHHGDAGHYRPLATLTLRLDRALWGESPGGYHATNVVLHLAVVGLALALARRLRRGESDWAWFGVALFAVHPALADSVAWISGRTSMVSAAGGLLGAWGVARLGARPVAVAATTTAGVLLALLGKEDGIVFAPVIALIALRASRGTALASAAGSAVAIGIWLALRHAALGSALPSSPAAPLGAEPFFFHRAGAAGRAVVEGLRIAAWPGGYPPGYAPEVFESAGIGDGILAAFGWTAVAALFVGGAWALHRGGRVVGASAIAVGCAIAPHLQIAPSGELFAPRFLYLPLCLGAPLVAATWTRVARGRAVSLGLLVLAACVPAAWVRAGVYADRASYWEARLQHQPKDASVWNALGNAHKEAGDIDAAVAAWTRATELEPDYSRPWNNLGGALVEAGDFDRAVLVLKHALATNPENAKAHHNLGIAQGRRGRWEDAEVSFERACGYAPGFAASWRALAGARLELGDPEAARAAIDRALALDPDDVRAQKLAARIDGH